MQCGILSCVKDHLDEDCRRLKARCADLQRSTNAQASQLRASMPPQHSSLRLSSDRWASADEVPATPRIGYSLIRITRRFYFRRAAFGPSGAHGLLRTPKKKKVICEDEEEEDYDKHVKESKE